MRKIVYIFLLFATSAGQGNNDLGLCGGAQNQSQQSKTKSGYQMKRYIATGRNKPSLPEKEDPDTHSCLLIRHLRQLEQWSRCAQR